MSFSMALVPQPLDLESDVIWLRSMIGVQILLGHAVFCLVVLLLWVFGVTRSLGQMLFTHNRSGFADGDEGATTPVLRHVY